jgi:hypothetical protein
MPNKTMAMKNKNTQRLGQVKIPSALGKMLKLNSAPDNAKFLISRFYWRQKWPRYIKILSAHNIPHTVILIGMI